MPRLTRRHLSRSRPLPVALLIGALAIPAVAGCEAGLNAPTLAFHPAAGGAYQTAGDVTISNAFVLGPAVGQQLAKGGQAGVFVSITAVGGDQLTSVSADGWASSVKVAGSPLTVPPQQPLNLTGPAPRIVLTHLSKSLSGGQTIELTFNFANAGGVTVKVPVEPQAYDYTTYAQPTVASPSPTASTTGKASAKASASATASATASASPSPKP